MFCDLVGSTAMSARLDPEDMRGIIGAYHKCCATLIERNGGFVAKYMGDGVLAYFGYPQAHEHDAERAVRAGSGDRRGRAEAGDGGRRAAACAGGHRDRDRGRRRSLGFGRGAGARGRRRHAKPCRTAAGDRRAGQRRHRRGHAQAAGRPVRAYRPRPAGPQGRRRADACLRGVARECRRRAGSRRCTRAASPRSWGARKRPNSCSGAGPEPRRAKGRSCCSPARPASASRDCRRRCWSGWRASRMCALRYFCSPQHADSALHPIIGHMARAAGLARDDTPQARLDKLDALLAQSATSREDAALLAEMLSLAERRPLSRARTRPRSSAGRRTMEALIGQMRGDCASSLRC